MKISHPQLEILGKNIKRLRKSKGFSQEELAAQCELGSTYISEVEGGKRNISALNLIRIARVLKINTGNLFENIN